MKPNNKHNKTPEELKKAIDGVIDQVSKSTLSINAICKQNGISKTTFFAYIFEHEEEKNRYARAKILQADPLFENLRKIARKNVIKEGSKDNHARLQQKQMEIETNGEEKLTMESFFENLKQTLKQTK